VLKSDAPDELATAIRQVDKKEQYISVRFAALSEEVVDENNNGQSPS
jgi:hypothetical protein